MRLTHHSLHIVPILGWLILSPFVIMGESFFWVKDTISQLSIHDVESDKMITKSTNTSDFQFNLVIKSENEVNVTDLVIELSALTYQDGVIGPEASITWQSRDGGSAPFSISGTGSLVLVIRGTLPRFTVYTGDLILSYGGKEDTYTLEITRTKPADLTVADLTNNTRTLKYSGSRLKQFIILENPLSNPEIDDLVLTMSPFIRSDGNLMDLEAFSLSPPEGDLLKLAPDERKNIYVIGDSLRNTKYEGWLEMAYSGKTQSIKLKIETGTAPVMVFKDLPKLDIDAWKGCKVNRTFFLQETGKGSDVLGVKVNISSGDIRGKEHNSVIRNDLVSFKAKPGIEAGDSSRVDLHLNLKGVSAGTYAGNIVVTSSNANEIAVPIEINVKHPPFFPAMMLIFGLLLTFYISSYVKYGKPRDEVLVRIKKLETELSNTHPKPFELFKDCISKEIRQAVDELNKSTEEGVKQADTQVTKGTVILNRWVSDRSRWVAEYANLETMEQEVNGWREAKFLKPLTAYLDKIKFKKITKYASAWDLRKDIKRLKTAFDTFNNARISVRDQFDKWHVQELEKEMRKEILGKLEELSKKLEGPDQPVIDETQINLPVGLPDYLTNLDATLNDLETQAQTASREANEQYSIYAGCRDEMPGLLNGIKVVMVKKVLEKVIKLAKDQVTKFEELNPQRAANLAGNAWYAAKMDTLFFEKARIATKKLTGGVQKSAQEKIVNLENFLRLDRNYDVGIEQYLRDIDPHLKAATDIISFTDPDFYESSLVELPQGKVDWKETTKPSEKTDTKPLVVKGMQIEDQIAGKHAQDLLDKAILWIAPKPTTRLNIFEAVTLLITAFALYFVAWNANYIAVSTFGTFAHYIELFFLGFGAEVTRTGMINLAKGWGVTLP